MLREIVEGLINNVPEKEYRALLKKYGKPTASLLSAKDRKAFDKELKQLSKSESFNHETLMAEDSDYQKFFQKKLKAWGVKSPAELDKEKRKKFFSEVEKEWK